MKGAVHAPRGEHHPEPGHIRLVNCHSAQGMSDLLPSPGACFYFAPPRPGDGDPEYVQRRLYLTLPWPGRPGRWEPHYCWIGDASDCHHWDGNVEHPTITPSILGVVGPADLPQWHGYLTRGVLVSV